MEILVAGGSGFVGRYVVNALIENGYYVTIITRYPNKVNINPQASIISWDSLDDYHAVDGIINLCGLGIADRLWRQKVKDQLIESRMVPTQKLINYMHKHADQSIQLLNASAIGFYPSAQKQQTENDYVSAGDDWFAHYLVKKWENKAFEAQNDGHPVTCMRFGVVLGDGGLLKKMLPGFKLGGGMVIGRGDETMSWVHINDLVKAMLHILKQNNPQPIYNVTAPYATTQQEFADTLAQILKRPRFLKMPRAMVSLLFGQMGRELLLVNQNIYPERLLHEHFVFDYPDIQTALKHLLHKQ